MSEREQHTEFGAEDDVFINRVTGRKAIPESPESYQKARRSYGLFAALLGAWELIGIELEKIGEYGTLETPQGAPVALLCLVVYFAFRITVEWLQA